ncbi:hypothetical protein JKA74_15915 [Marivirga sp. S37H4]|uniref:Uncharacterized protein n=1 Tax=Marivirga aurantiaca TaxID=2802615 RepID=A0A935CB20_9BACT|nr:hypothetical protein [Marivirga aurantiaca]MBK6266532.1 hypothetical protein [Marivirga aurantiaca]
MKKYPLIIIIVFLLLSSAVFYGYNYVYPRVVAHAIVSKQYVGLLPEKFKDRIELISDTVNQRVSRMFEITEDNGVTMDDLLNAIDEIEEQEVRNALAELYETDIQSVEQVYEIGVKHIKIQSFDPQVLRAPFIEHVKLHHVKKGLKYIKRHDLQNQMSSKSARSIAKQILIQKKEKIQSKADIKD